MIEMIMLNQNPKHKAMKMISFQNLLRSENPFQLWYVPYLEDSCWLLTD